MAYQTRQKVLGGDMSKYRCCQGYMDDICCGIVKSGQCCESTCPSLCLCVESICCIGPAVSSTRIFMMDQYQLSSDACDRKLIRLSNCLQGVSCMCTPFLFHLRSTICSMPRLTKPRHSHIMFHASRLLILVELHMLHPCIPYARV
jgi:hypothetical protein